MTVFVTPAKGGAQPEKGNAWAPAFAGVTEGER
jgi:hypothetical protein